MRHRDETSFERQSSQRLELLITVLGLLSLVFFLIFYDRAFPSAALDLSLSRTEIKQRAQTYLQERGYDLDDYKSAVTFADSYWPSIYLQRTLGIPEANRLIEEDKLPIWYWRARWFRPLQKEGFRAYLAPDGRVVGLSHTLLESEPGASLPQDEARTLAETYLSEERGWDLDDWEEVSASSNERPGERIDHNFSWKRGDWDVGESQLRLSVTVQGDEIGHYDYWLKVPEEFKRHFSERRSVAGFVTTLSIVMSCILLGLIPILALWRSRWQVPLSLKRALWPALAVAVVTALAELNELPLAKAWYGTTEDYWLFWFYQVAIVAFRAIFCGGAVFGIWMLGHWLSQRVWPRRDRILARRGDRWRHLARSGWRGLMLGMMSGGYAVLFYLVATQMLGGWTPMTPDYTSAYATPLPFLGALETGLIPAMTEELWFRLLLISGVLWLTRTFTSWPEAACRILAVVVPGALWGFAHTSYVCDPFYLRGIELTLAGVLFEGLFFLRFDLTTTIVAHFAYNAGLGALPLLRSGEPYFVASGAVVLLAMLAPTVPYLFQELRRYLRGEPREFIRPRIRVLEASDRERLEAISIDGLDWAGLLKDPGAVVLGLEADDDIVGVASGRLSAEDEADVLALYVDPAWRRRYWGSELLDELSGRLQERGAETVHTRVDVDDERAVYFMTSQPWRQVRIIFDWPSEPPTLPDWHTLLEKLGLKRQREQAMGD